MAKAAKAPVTFLASFPPIASAILISGQGDGMKLRLDVPETEMANAVRLLGMREHVLRVAVEVVD